MAYDGDGEYLPGEWCTFCKVSVKCRARAEEKMKLARLEFKMPPLLTDAEIEEVLDVLPDLPKWANEMQKLMGKSAFEEILGDLIYKPPGKPILVPNTDKRPAMNVTNAENEFDKIMED